MLGGRKISDQMKLIIKNPAPNDHRMKKWGDYHFGRCLTKYLTRAGIEVVTHYKSEWGKKDRADAVLALRGKYPYYPESGAKNILWVYSHPAGIGDSELGSYDAVCVASDSHAAEIRKTLNMPVITLLQCTDHEEFFPPEEDRKREGVVFVGNTRSVPRPCVQWAIEYGLDLRVWGRGWKDFIDEKYIAGEYIGNEELGGLYRKSRFTINDHWNDMRGFGYINNRIFDALACGLPVISDCHESLRERFPEGILYYETRDDFFRCLDRMLGHYDSVAEKALPACKAVVNDYTFEKRAGQLADLISSIKTGQTVNAAAPGRCIRRLIGRRGVPSHVPPSYRMLQKKFKRADGKLFCPVCLSFIDGFIAETDEAHDSLRCPRCSSMERHRVFWAYFSNHVAPALPGRAVSILHISPEKPLMQKLGELDNAVYTSMDASSRMAMVKADPADTFFPDGRFDLVVFSRMPGNGEYNPSLFIEMARILKNDGKAVFHLPCKGAIPAEGFEKISGEIGKAGFAVRPVMVCKEVRIGMAAFLGLNDSVILECAKESHD